MSEKKVVIIGTGAAGLGAAFRLYEQGYRSFLAIESGPEIAQNIRPVVDEQGFTWDPAGRGISAKHGYFSELMRSMCEPWTQQTRPSACLVGGQMVPNPVQRNIQQLPHAQFVRFLDGMAAAAATAGKKSVESANSTSTHNLHEWLTAHFGGPLTEEVFVPFARKRWGCHPAELEADWANNKIAAADHRSILTDVLSGTNQQPDAVYMYPSASYSSSLDLWNGLLQCIPQMHFRFNSQVVAIDADAKQVQLEDGSKEGYDVLISTMPLDRLCAMVQPLQDNANLFKHASIHFVGVGLQGQPPAQLADKSWIYCADEGVPFFRVTVMSNYSPRLLPPASSSTTHWSLLCETCEPATKTVDASAVVEETIAGLLKLGFVAAADDVVSRCHWRQEYGTPLPFVGSSQAVREIQTHLAAADIHSIGRLGAWDYELSGLSDSFLQGVRCVDHLLQLEDKSLNALRGHVPTLAPVGAQWQAKRPVYTVLVDMDNTLCNYEEAFERTVREHFPHIEIVPQARRLHWHIELDYPEEYRQQVVSVNSIPGFFRNMKPNEYGCEALHEMLAEGLEVFIVTAPDPVTTAQCVAEKVRWVEEYLGSEWKHRLILTRDKTTIAGDVLIDDKPTCHLGRAKPGWKHVVFHQMYNADLPNRRRIRHWRDWRQTLFPRLSRQLPATLFPGGAVAFSYVVTTHDAQLNQLRKTLDAIIAQTTNMQELIAHEVLVIDDHTCSLYPIYLEYREKCDLRFINEIPSGASSAINTGVEVAKHPYVIVVDWCSDLAEHPSLVPKLARYLSTSNHCIPHVFATEHGVLGFPKPAWQSLPEGRSRVAVSGIVQLLMQDGCTRLPMEALLLSDGDGTGVERLSS